MKTIKSQIFHILTIITTLKNDTNTWSVEKIKTSVML